MFGRRFFFGFGVRPYNPLGVVLTAERDGNLRPTLIGLTLDGKTLIGNGGFPLGLPNCSRRVKVEGEVLGSFSGSTKLFAGWVGLKLETKKR